MIITTFLRPASWTLQVHRRNGKAFQGCTIHFAPNGDLSITPARTAEANLSWQVSPLPSAADPPTVLLDHFIAQNAVHSRYIFLLVVVMSGLKTETLSIRTSAEIKRLLRLAAEQEHRSVASMIEVLVLDYASKHRLEGERPPQEPAQRRRA